MSEPTAPTALASFEPHPKGTQPTHQIVLREKAGERRGVVAVGWEEEDGSISLSINAGVVLSWRDDVTLRLKRIPREIREARAERSAPFAPERALPAVTDAASVARTVRSHLHFAKNDGVAACGVSVDGLDSVYEIRPFFQRSKRGRCADCEAWVKRTFTPPKKMHLAADPPDPGHPHACDTFARVALEHVTTDPSAVTCKLCLRYVKKPEPVAEASAQAASAVQEEGA